MIYTKMITTMLNEKGGLPVKIRDSVVFVTGANRGIGLEFAQELLAVGALKGLCRSPKSRTHSARLK